MPKRTSALFVALLLVLAACGTAAEDGATTTSAGDDVTTSAGDGATTTSAGDGATTTGAEEMDGVHGVDTDLGTILVDAEGFTLYVFTNDTGGESSCDESCAATWPPVPGDSEIGSDLDAAMFGTTTRGDGSEQLTVNDMPLYRYAPDSAPGDTNGQGVGGVWFVVDTSGAMVEGPEANNDSTTSSDDGIDY